MGAASSSKRAAVDWIAVDWGSSRLRAWGMDAAGAVLAEASSDAGAGGLTPGGFEPALLSLVEFWLGEAPALVVVCGMAGARQGWAEAPYAQVPCPPARGHVPAPARDPRLDVRLLAGIAQTAPPDVMRGEETQIAGLLAVDPGFDGVVCLPGTHCKWVHVTGGEVFHFASFMTGELFDLLARRSVLRHTVAEAGHEPEAFAEALDEAMSRPERAFARLFPLRAAALVGEADPAAARARLSGLLIGAELAGAKAYWLGRRVAVIGEAGLADLYAAALERTGLRPERHDAVACTLDGLRAARLAMMEGPGCRAS